VLTLKLLINNFISVILQFIDNLLLLYLISKQNQVHSFNFFPKTGLSFNFFDIP